jgi:ankyrin repeat protein
MLFSLAHFLSLPRFTFQAATCPSSRFTRAAEIGDQTTVREIFQTNLIPISIINEALISASSKGHIEVVKILINEVGAKINATDNYNRHTPLNLAADQGHVDIVRFLIEKNAEVNHVDVLGQTALIAVSLGWENVTDYFDIVKILIENKAELNHVDELGNTALSIAIEHESAEVVDLLVSAGADTSRFAETQLVNQAIGKLYKSAFKEFTSFVSVLPAMYTPLVEIVEETLDYQSENLVSVRRKHNLIKPR